MEEGCNCRRMEEVGEGGRNDSARNWVVLEVLHYCLSALLDRNCTTLLLAGSHLQHPRVGWLVVLASLVGLVLHTCSCMGCSNIGGVVGGRVGDVGWVVVCVGRLV